MKPRITLMLLLIVSLLLSVGAGARSAPPYHVESGNLAGGNYQLTSSAVQAGNVAAGGAYRLLGPSEPNLQVGGCCCTWIPCVLGNP
jgi:hypothetical protein